MEGERAVDLAGHLVGPGHPPLVIAEMSGNHNQSLERAFQIVDAAAQAGAHAIKLQTYTAETMTLDSGADDFVIADESSPWTGKSLYSLYEEAHTPWEWHRAIFDRARSHGMLAFSTPFDESAVDFLEELDVPCYKIASFENAHLPLIRKVASTGRPIIMSTGMASEEELAEAVGAARDAGCDELILLKCTSTYPASVADSNLAAIPVIASTFGCLVGLSDHTLGLAAPIAAVALGACVVEKHFTLSRADGGVDSSFSLEPAELAALVIETERAWEALGKAEIGPAPAEIESRRFRRSIYVSADMKAGDILGPDNIRVVRPGNGLLPKHYDEVVGRPVTRDVEHGTPLSWDLVGR